MVSYHGPLNLIKYSLMIPKRNSDLKKKGPVQEEKVNSTEGKLQGERNMSIMDERDEFILFVQSMLEILQDISHNICSMDKKPECSWQSK